MSLFLNVIVEEIEDGRIAVKIEHLNPASVPIITLTYEDGEVVKLPPFYRPVILIEKKKSAIVALNVKL